MSISTPVEELNSKQKQFLADHFIRLSPDDRQLRFNSWSTNAAITSYVGSLDFSRDIILGIWENNSSLIAVGHLTFFTDKKIACICLTVDPSFRRSGYGSVLIEQAKRIALKRSCLELKIPISFSNVPARNLAQKNGFSVLLGKDGEWDCSFLLTSVEK